MKIRQLLQTFWKRVLSLKITFLCIFHSPRGPIKKQFSVAFLLFIIFMWTFITAISVYLSSKHIDYWSAKLKSVILKSKYEYVTRELSKSLELLAKVEENDRTIRKLLNMKDKKEIILKSDNLNQGGPLLKDSQLLQKIALQPEKVSMPEYNTYLSYLKQKLKLQLQSHQEIMNYISLQKELYRYTPLIWPTYGHVTSPFGFRIHPVYQVKDFHSGLDIANVIGTPIYATADGVVKFAGWQFGYGKVVVIEHKFGYRTVYGHLSKIKVEVGQKVRRRDVIGYMGDTGTTTGPHLHYEVWKDDKLQNPIRFVNPEKFFEG